MPNASLSWFCHVQIRVTSLFVHLFKRVLEEETWYRHEVVPSCSIVCGYRRTNMTACNSVGKTRAPWRSGLCPWRLLAVLPVQARVRVPFLPQAQVEMQRMTVIYAV